MWKIFTAAEFLKYFQAAGGVELGDLPSYDFILSGLNRQVIGKSRSCRVNRFRTLKNNIWIFRVVCTQDTYTVSLQAADEGNGKQIKIKCTCPHWRWGGPDYNAYKGNYLYKDPASNLAFPAVRDPQLKNKVCKHAYAVLDSSKDYLVDWAINEEKQKEQRRKERDQRKMERENRRQKQELERADKGREEKERSERLRRDKEQRQKEREDRGRRVTQQPGKTPAEAFEEQRRTRPKTRDIEQY